MLGQKVLWPTAYRKGEDVTCLCSHLWHLWDSEEMRKFFLVLSHRGDEQSWENPFLMISGIYVFTKYRPCKWEVTHFGWSDHFKHCKQSPSSSPEATWWSGGYNLKDWDQLDLVEILPLTEVTTAKLCNFIETQFPHRQIRGRTTDLAQLLWGVNELMHADSLVHNRYPMIKSSDLYYFSPSFSSSPFYIKRV